MTTERATRFRFGEAMGGYSFDTHPGQCASWVGRLAHGGWIGVDPWGRQQRGFPTRAAAATWCAAAATPEEFSEVAEEQEEDYEGEARLQRWERAREEWWA